ncbi:MAG: cupin domain-containing protein [Rhodospirillaceae bacterium]|nr:cupin domain-containing protein [Rhodospirillaceae bacterium]MBT5945351.1 cupin domain-containing protein [Rhodospirillaceae bacterium]MBT6403661.1 cupin domain-containing protein [Rhodospirillaceae bacterium]MBT6537358.1 cupin domain-containing protein [Rhodospirillaceae bacterium]MBT7361761.1 cupin domain-containing protein [Rhodospirillaceae bacterium]
MTFETTQLGTEIDAIAPDGSEIRLLGARPGGTFAHCTLPPGAISLAVRHRTVEEIWYVLSGDGEVWRSFEGAEEVTHVTTGTALTIPLGTHFQFRSVGDEPLRFVLSTMPPWPGEDEAVRVDDHWPADAGNEDGASN